MSKDFGITSVTLLININVHKISTKITENCMPPPQRENTYRFVWCIKTVHEDQEDVFMVHEDQVENCSNKSYINSRKGVGFNQTARRQRVGEGYLNK